MAPWLVVGLGNPGPGYANHRHSVGRMALDALAGRAEVSFASARLKRFDSAIIWLSSAGLGPSPSAKKVVLVKSRTFMNESGVAVAKAAAYHGVKPDHVIVVHDELDLDFGQLRLKFGGGDNGHNGLKSLRAHLRTGDFFRVRFGIGRPPGRMDPAEFVLRPFTAAERAELPPMLEQVGDAIQDLVVSGLEHAQNRFNS
jgi:PTH1 family peptidyl-tRNA hydrolase